MLEWAGDNFEYTVEIDEHQQMFLCADNTATDDLVEATVAFDAARLLRFMTTGTLE